MLRTKLKGDLIDPSIQREYDYICKKSTCVKAEATFRTALESHTVLGEVQSGSSM